MVTVTHIFLGSLHNSNELTFLLEGGAGKKAFSLENWVYKIWPIERGWGAGGKQ
jgi:hypothetical protein